jgi:hypothetical protein
MVNQFENQLRHHYVGDNASTQMVVETIGRLILAGTPPVN